MSQPPPPQRVTEILRTEFSPQSSASVPTASASLVQSHEHEQVLMGDSMPSACSEGVIDVPFVVNYLYVTVVHHCFTICGVLIRDFANYNFTIPISNLTLTVILLDYSIFCLYFHDL